MTMVTAMGFSVKLAPGVRVRSSSRGVRTSIGPRAARVHVGGGRAGFSTGIGPVSYYTSVGSTKRSGGIGRSTGGSRAAATGATSRQLEQAVQLDKAQEIASILSNILVIHRADFDPAERPMAALEAQGDRDQFIRAHERQAVDGIGIFHRAERKQAMLRARVEAEEQLEQHRQALEAERADRQVALDEEWSQLLDNDPDTVMAALAGAFEDNEAAAAPLGVEDGVASVMVQVPDPDLVPERMPSVTAAGNPSLRKMTKRERNDFYSLMVVGYAIVTVKEALAVAPGLDGVRVLAVRASRPDAYGASHTEAILAASFTRASLEGIRWDDTTSADVLNAAATDVVLVQKGAAKELQPIDLNANPGVAEAVNVIDLTPAAGD